MEAEKLNLMQKLAKIRSMSDAVVKSKKGFNYSYSDITDILANITAGMKKYGVSLIPGIVPDTAEITQNVVVNTKMSKDGKPFDQTVTEMLVKAEMVFKWVNDDNPEEFVEVPWLITGSQADPSQAFGSGLTYCTRYFLTNYFNIAQTNADVDTYRSKQKQAEANEDKTIAEEIINTFDAELKEYMEAHSDKAAEIKAFIAKYAKNSNYFAIKEPVLAAKLKNDFEAKYLGKKNAA